MKLLSNTWNGYTRLKWTKAETASYLLRRFSEKTKIAYPFFEKRLRKAKHQSVMRFFDPAEKCFNFNGAKIPDISQHPIHMDALRHVFEDVFLFHCHYGENYHKELVETLDKSMVEGPYGYIDGAFDVTVKPGDIVIDAGHGSATSALMQPPNEPQAMLSNQPTAPTPGSAKQPA